MFSAAQEGAGVTPESRREGGPWGGAVSTWPGEPCRSGSAEFSGLIGCDISCLSVASRSLHCSERPPRLQPIRHRPGFFPSQSEAGLRLLFCYFECCFWGQQHGKELRSQLAALFHRHTMERWEVTAAKIRGIFFGGGGGVEQNNPPCPSNPGGRGLCLPMVTARHSHDATLISVFYLFLK